MKECCLLYCLLPSCILQAGGYFLYCDIVVILGCVSSLLFIYLLYVCGFYFCLSSLPQSLSSPSFHTLTLSHQPASVEIVTEHQMMEETLAKLEIAQKKLAVCYFSLIMDLDMGQHCNTAYHK